MDSSPRVPLTYHTLGVSTCDPDGRMRVIRELVCVKIDESPQGPLVETRAEQMAHENDRPRVLLG
jgi:hypothetical protein